jgi:hypothetical protein
MKKTRIPLNTIAFFTDCPKCGMETNKDRVIEILEQTYEEGYKKGYCDSLLWLKTIMMQRLIDKGEKNI